MVSLGGIKIGGSAILALALVGAVIFFRKDIANAVTGGLSGTAEAIGGAGTTITNFFGGIPDAVAESIPTPQGDQGSLFDAGQQVGSFFGGITDFFNNLFNPLPSADAPLVPEIPSPPPDLSIPVAPSIASTVIAPFQGGGISFEGGQIFETPIENLSLSQIIDKFMVTASQAADIKAQAIGFTPEEQAFLNQGSQDVGGFVSGGPTQTSDPQFQGLTPEQIFQKLVGGVISNF